MLWGAWKYGFVRPFKTGGGEKLAWCWSNNINPVLTLGIGEQPTTGKGSDCVPGKATGSLTWSMRGTILFCSSSRMYLCLCCNEGWARGVQLMSVLQHGSGWMIFRCRAAVYLSAVSRRVVCKGLCLCLVKEYLLSPFFLLCRPYTAKCEPVFSLSPLQCGMPKRFWLILSSGMLLFLSALLVILPQRPLKHWGVPWGHHSCRVPQEPLSSVWWWDPAAPLLGCGSRDSPASRKALWVLCQLRAFCFVLLDCEAKEVG